MMHGFNFSERVRKVLALARQEAARMGHEYLGTEHILLGLLREGAGVASAVLEKLGVDAAEVRQRLEAVVEKGTAGAGGDITLPYTSRAKKVLEFAILEVQALDHNFVGTEHLLLGLLREEHGIAAQVLREQGAELGAARQEVLRLLGRPPTERERMARVEVPGAPGAGTFRPVRVAVQVDCEGGAWFGERFERVADAIAYLRAFESKAPGPDEPPPPRAAT